MAVVCMGFFLTAIILCCCTQSVAHAFPVTSKASVPSCHAPKAKADAPAQTDCSCCTIKKLQAEKVGALTTITPVFQSLAFDHHDQSLFPAAKHVLLATTHGPPDQSTDTPLYILFHSIRC